MRVGDAPNSRSPESFLLLSSDGPVIVGRGGSIVVDSTLHPAQISRHHAVLEVVRGDLVVVDVSSINGMYVDRKRLLWNQPTVVPPGRVIIFGGAVDVAYRVHRYVSPIGGANDTNGDKTGPTVATAAANGGPFRRSEVTPTRLASLRPQTPRVRPLARGVPCALHADPCKEVPQEKLQLVAENKGLPLTPQQKVQYRVSNSLLLVEDNLRRVVKLSDLSAFHNNAEEALVTRAGYDALLVASICELSDVADCTNKFPKTILDLLYSAYDRPHDAFRYPSVGGVPDDDIKFQLRVGLSTLCRRMRQIFTGSPLLVHVKPPTLVCGDIHGSFSDLHYVFEQIVPFGCVKYMTSPVVFLGDFVDRGRYSVQVVMFLFAWKALNPQKVLLLRGNHEDSDVNGDVAQYGEGAFLSRCIELFGEECGRSLWEDVNSVFTLLPLAVQIGDGILACHGGIPRGTPYDPEQHSTDVPALACSNTDTLRGIVAPGRPTTLADWLLSPAFPRLPHVMPNPADDESTAECRRIVRELLWNDPTADSWGEAALDSEGFRPNTVRGDCGHYVLEFTKAALEAFLARNEVSLFIRAHQHKGKGVQLVHGGHLVTVFTSSNYSAENAAGACLVLPDGKVRLVSWHQSTTTLFPTGDESARGASSSWESGRVPCAAAQSCEKEEKEEAANDDNNCLDVTPSSEPPPNPADVKVGAAISTDSCRARHTLPTRVASGSTGALAATLESNNGAESASVHSTPRRQLTPRNGLKDDETNRVCG